MSWNFNNESLSQYSPRNFMADNSVFIQDEITPENCAYLICDMQKFIMSTDNHRGELNIVINSVGGDYYVMNQITGLMAIAKLRNIEVVTWVMGMACSAGSIIAIQGTHRWMAKNAIHMIHFGSTIELYTKESELEKAMRHNKEWAKRVSQVYLDHCPGLTESKLNQLCEDEQGRLFADECLKYGVCDYIIEDELENKIREDQKDQDLLNEIMQLKKKKKSETIKAQPKTKRQRVKK